MAKKSTKKAATKKVMKKPAVKAANKPAKKTGAKKSKAVKEFVAMQSCPCDHYAHKEIREVRSKGGGARTKGLFDFFKKHGETPPNAPAPNAVAHHPGSDDWRVAKSLLKLRAQVNAMAPDRAKDNDGTIGDANHQNHNSDHNPWVDDGVVTAMDITNDPNNGCSADALAESIRAARDQRVKYLIWNRRICNHAALDGEPAWAWRPYNGTNPHDHHVHISVKSDVEFYDDESAWDIALA